MKTVHSLHRLGMGDADWVTDLLTEAFLDEPPSTHLFRGRRRCEQVRYFMGCSCSYALRFGECYTTPERNGVALWLTPGNTTMTLGRMYRAGMLAAPLRLSPGAFVRFLRLALHIDKHHKQCAPVPHYYLFVLGVRPAAQGRGVGRRLLEGMLERVDAERAPAYLETQKEGNVGFYQKFGFEVTAEGAFPKLPGLTNWGMLRKSVGSNETRSNLTQPP